LERVGAIFSTDSVISGSFVYSKHLKRAKSKGKLNSCDCESFSSWL
jgi:hypothetical protein